MGLFITGSFLPLDITDEQWTSVYKEALKLVEAYDFLDMIADKERFKKYRLTWYYAEKTVERNVDGNVGIAIYCWR